MKTNVLLAGMFVALIASVSVYAQPNDPAVKILPASEQGILKVIYAQSTGNLVAIKFIDENGPLKTDRIQAERFKRGFYKRYDVSRIKSDRFWIEVKSDEMTVRYQLVKDQSGRFVPRLEQAIYNHSLLATLN